MSNGKGSKPRPKSVDAETFASNWDAVFKQEQEAPLFRAYKDALGFPHDVLEGPCACGAWHSKERPPPQPWRANHFGAGPDDGGKS